MQIFTFILGIILGVNTCTWPYSYLPSKFAKARLDKFREPCWKKPSPIPRVGPKEPSVQSVPDAKLELTMDCRGSDDFCNQVKRGIAITSWFFENTILLKHSLKGHIRIFPLSQNTTIAQVRASQYIYTFDQDILYPQAVAKQLEDDYAYLRNFQPFDFEIDINSDIQFHFSHQRTSVGFTDTLARSIIHGLGVVSEFSPHINIQKYIFFTPGIQRYQYFEDADNANSRHTEIKFMDSLFDTHLYMRYDYLSNYTTVYNSFLSPFTRNVTEFIKRLFEPDMYFYLSMVRYAGDTPRRSFFVSHDGTTARINIFMDDFLTDANDSDTVARVYLNHQGRPVSRTRAIVMNEFANKVPHYTKQPFDIINLRILRGLGYITHPDIPKTLPHTSIQSTCGKRAWL
ncbi:hypothetical protein DSO57_1007011 [Entomophthora muscae]|uniref:Uncharacterized protein n=1 Tax=Entomophthora muscae TaxID=34485 RepID=A0ACC2RM65_9FUNG|nr:hypothetical protein DSO57_1007011 [Entomophthora muscae]